MAVSFDPILRLCLILGPLYLTQGLPSSRSYDSRPSILVLTLQLLEPYPGEVAQQCACCARHALNRAYAPSSAPPGETDRTASARPAPPVSCCASWSESVTKWSGSGQDLRSPTRYIHVQKHSEVGR